MVGKAERSRTNMSHNEDSCHKTLSSASVPVLLHHIVNASVILHCTGRPKINRQIYYLQVNVKVCALITRVRTVRLV